MLSREPCLFGSLTESPSGSAGSPEWPDPRSDRAENVMYCGRKIKPNQRGLKPIRPVRKTDGEHQTGGKGTRNTAQCIYSKIPIQYHSAVWTHYLNFLLDYCLFKLVLFFRLQLAYSQVLAGWCDVNVWWWDVKCLCALLARQKWQCTAKAFASVTKNKTQYKSLSLSYIHASSSLWQSWPSPLGHVPHLGRGPCYLENRRHYCPRLHPTEWNTFRVMERMGGLSCFFSLLLSMFKCLWLALIQDLLKGVTFIINCINKKCHTLA